MPLMVTLAFPTFFPAFSVIVFPECDIVTIFLFDVLTDVMTAPFVIFSPVVLWPVFKTTVPALNVGAGFGRFATDLVSVYPQDEQVRAS